MPPSIDAVTDGTVRGVHFRARGRRSRLDRDILGFVMSDGSIVPLGGKTGTGDNRIKSFAAGGRWPTRAWRTGRQFLPS